MNESQRTVLKGNTFPLARPQYDHGPAPASLPMDRMILVLKRSPQQQASLTALLQQQQEKSSPNYHHWLTPAQFGTQFGLAKQDIQTIVDWLQSQGFQVNRVANGRGVIEFSGTAGQVQQAFQTAIHKYVVKGRAHWANASDPEIPTALAPAVAGIDSLNNFRRKSMHVVAGIFRRSKTTGRAIPVQPAYTFTNSNGTFYALGPYDFATIYNVLPLWNAGIDGTGESIAIIGRSDINVQDVDDFRSMFGMPAPNINVIPNGPGPGIVSGDETESDLDVEWAGAIAKGATIDFVVSESTEASDGVDLSAEYAVDQDIAPVLSDSYGACELDMGTAGNQFYDQLWQQAAAEGITVVVASGDGGSALCDEGNIGASLGLTVNGTASTPYDVAAGGTDFSDALDPTTYWSSTNNSTTGASALGYIPEGVWNDTCTNPELASVAGLSSDAETNCNDSNLILQNSFLLQVVGGSGGASNCITSTGQSLSSCGGGYPKPAWQTGPGVPNDGVRDLPDISLFSGNGFNGNFYILCEADQQGGPCSLSSQAFLGVGGTSAAAPTFAAIIAMVDQQTKSRQGNANYVLYPLAAKTGASCNSSVTVTSSCIFYDVVAGTNAMPCVTETPDCVTNTVGDEYGVLSGFNATTGYDLATGLGSVNADNLVSNWGRVTFTPSTTTLQLNGGNPVNVAHGTSVPVSIAVSPSSPAPTGVVTLIAEDNGKTLNAGTFTLSNGAVSGSTTLLPGGSGYNVVARYAGDGTYGTSESNPVTVTVSSEASKTFANLVTFDANDNLTSYSASSATYGTGYYLLRVDVGNSTATYSATTGISSTCSNGTASCPTGAVTVTNNGSPLGSESLPLNVNGYAEDQSPVAGTYVVSASYPGDSSYSSSSTTASFTINKGPTETSITSPGGSVPYGTDHYQDIGASVNTEGAIVGAEPTGTFAFSLDGSPLAVSDLQYGGNAGAGPSGGVEAGYYVSGKVAFLSLGNHTLTVQYSGDKNYTSSTGSVVPFSIDQAQPSFNRITANPSSPATNQKTTLTALMYGSEAGVAPTGTITFYENGTAIPGTVTYTSAGPTATQDSYLQATTTWTPTATGSYVIAAQYSGDTYYLPTSGGEQTVTVVSPDFSIAAPSTTINIGSPGGTATGSVTVSSSNGFIGNIGLAVTCPSGVGITCSLSPSSVALSSTTTSASTTLTVASTAPSMLPPGEKPAGPGWPGDGLEIALAGILGLLVLWLVFWKRKSERRWSTALGLLALASLLAMSACGGGSHSSTPPPPSNPGTPSGSYTATVTATSGSLSHSTTVGFSVQ